MRKNLLYIGIAATLMTTLLSDVTANAQRFRYVKYPALFSREKVKEEPRSVDEIIESLPPLYYSDTTTFIAPGINIFSGDVVDALPDSLSLAPMQPRLTKSSKDDVMAYQQPQWLSEGITRYNAAKRVENIYMLSHPEQIAFFSWELPEPPELMTINNMQPTPASHDIPEPSLPQLQDTPRDLIKRHWLHTAAASVQFSQAYISPNWYQGGENNVTLLINGQWNVKLNQVYHPDQLLESTLHYKLGLYSTPNDDYHNYSISEDLLQWNLTAGLKAFKKWYYSCNVQFKTQLLHNYGTNSQVMKAAFMSSGELNVGLGMTYSTENKKRGLKFQASLAPLSYNLKTCLNNKVDPTLFNIPEGKKSTNEFGSSADLTMTWQLATNITYTSHMFLFSNYKYFTGDWENTFNFTINRFLSTQIYVHGRFDSSVSTKSKGWKKWMLKEILSFGFAYSFSTIPNKK
jgi:hypothetical protein